MSQETLTAPSTVYHGTDADSIEEILNDGLQPRTATGKSNWEERNVPSIEDMVYLTRLYAPFFGMAATDNNSIAIVEVDRELLDEYNQFPDEDFVTAFANMEPEQFEQFGVPLEGELDERTKTARDNIEAFQMLWEDSVIALGNMAYRGGVPPEAIPRISEVELPTELRFSIDPTITVQNAQLTGVFYDMVTKMLMQDVDVTPDMYMEYQHAVGPSMERCEMPQFQSDDAKEALRGGPQRESAEVICATDEYVTIHENPAYNHG